MKIVLFKALVLTLCVAVTSCSNDTSTKWNGGESVKTIESIQFSRAEESANEAFNEFAFKSFNESAKLYNDCYVNDNTGNISFSPLSLSLNLVLRATSFDLDTEKTTLRAFGVDDLSSLKTVCNKLMQFIPDKSNGGTTVIANSIWYNDIYALSPSYVKEMAQLFYCDIVGVDVDNPVKAQNAINGWCSQVTKGMIGEFPTLINQDMVAMILNAMYYAGDWENPFNSSYTKKSIFHGSNGDSSCLFMERLLQNVSYFQNDRVDAVSLKFAGNNRMVAVLPHHGVPIEELSQTISHNEWRSLTEKHELQDVIIYFPKFEQTSTILLNKIIEQLGVKTKSVNPQQMGITKPFDSNIKQIAKISVDEKGATIAAITGDGGLIAPPPGRQIEMRFDRPFLYFIENTVTGTILMAGRICNL